MTSLHPTLRSLASRPAFAAGVVVLLAIGVGAASAISSLVDAVLFRPIVAERPEELVRIYATDEHHSEIRGNCSYPVYTDYRDGSRAFAGLAAWTDWLAVHVARAGEVPERVPAALASGNFFAVLGTRAALGRTLLASDETPGGDPRVAVLSDTYWKSRFGGDPAAVGSTVRINGFPFTVVGVLSAEFHGASLTAAPRIWLPLAVAAEADPEYKNLDPLHARNFSWLETIGRLAPGARAPRAQAELDVIAARRAAVEPANDREPYALLVSAGDFALGDSGRSEKRRIAWLLAGFSGLLLVTTAANAAGLFVARANERRRELAVRAALGATRRRLSAELLLEGSILGVLGGVGGTFAAGGLLALVRSWIPDLPLPLEASTSIASWRGLLFVAATTGFAALLFALGPALGAGRGDLAAFLQARTDSTRRLGGTLRLRHALVVAQVALSVLLVAGAALFLRTLSEATNVPLGFNPAGVLLASFDLAKQGYDTERARGFREALLERVRATPGVEAAALGYLFPIQPSGFRRTVRAEGYKFASGEDEAIDTNGVSQGYFETLSIPLVAGRDFSAADTATSPNVAIVNRAFVERYFRGENPIGRHLYDSGEDPWSAEIVGVAGNVRSRSFREERARPLFYLPTTQFQRGSTTIAVRTACPPGGDANGLLAPPAALTLLAGVGCSAESFAPALRRIAAQLDPELPLFRVQSLADHIGEALSQERTLARLLGLFALLALGVAASGIYAVVAYATRLRRKEFGVRLALGSSATELRRLVLVEGGALAGVGALLGLAATGFAAPLVASLFYRVSPSDGWSLAAAALLITGVALAACWGPAGVAARLDPARVLREE